MTEHDAQTWIKENFCVSRETWERLEAFEAFLKREAVSQNLISASTLDSIWSRHIVDSAQLMKLLPDEFEAKNWIDLGSGAGFPGLIISILSKHEMTLVESRTRRIDYLARAVEMLGLQDHVTIAGMPLERFPTAPYSVISARAFAPLPKLFKLAARFSTDKTIWLLPKGRNAAKEWEEARPAACDGDFRIEPSVTDSESGIMVGRMSAFRQETL